MTRPDLMDRAIVVDLASIPEDRRRPEDEFYATLQVARPRLLGALLTAASSAFAREDQITIKQLPRMADATRWITAAEGALRWPERSFLTAYRGNRSNSRALTLDASPLAAPINLLITDEWSGTATDLLKALEHHVDESVIKRKDWPKTAQVLGVEIRRLAPDLRKVAAIEVTFAARHGGGRLISLVRVRETASQPSQPSSEPAVRDAGDNESPTRTNGASVFWRAPDDDDDDLDHGPGATAPRCDHCGHTKVEATPGRWVCTNAPGIASVPA